MLSLQSFATPIICSGGYIQLYDLFPTVINTKILTRLESLPQPVCCSIYSSPSNIQTPGIHVKYATPEELSNILLITLCRICGTLPVDYARETFNKFVQEISKFVNISGFKQDLEKFVLDCNQTNCGRIYNYIHNNEYIYNLFTITLQSLNVPLDTSFNDIEEFSSVFDIDPARRLFLKEIQFSIFSEKIFCVGVTSIPTDLIYYFSLGKTSPDLLSGINNTSFITLPLINILKILDIENCFTAEDLLFETSLIENSFYSSINTNCYAPVTHAIFKYALQHNCTNKLQFRDILFKLREEMLPC